MPLVAFLVIYCSVSFSVVWNYREVGMMLAFGVSYVPSPDTCSLVMFTSFLSDLCVKISRAFAVVVLLAIVIPQSISGNIRFIPFYFGIMQVTAYVDTFYCKITILCKTSH